MLYALHELQRSFLTPMSSFAAEASRVFATPPLSLLPFADRAAAGYELLHRLGKRYEKPAFGLEETLLDGGDGTPVIVNEQVVIKKPFCRLVRFQRNVPKDRPADPTVLLVAPLSGHHATLLRQTVQRLLPAHDVYVTDWLDARMVPLDAGAFHLHDYVAYVQEFMRHLGPRTHVISVCQPTVPVLAAISLMATENDPNLPLSMTMMGGPIDVRRSPTQVNALATEHSYDWFEQYMIYTVPPGYPGSGRRVYPGFLQLMGFVAMNPQHHLRSHYDFYLDLVKGNGDTADSHRRFYDEYNAVLDMPAEYYLETVKTVFQDFSLARGTWEIGGKRVAPEDIRNIALFTIEGELDDISGAGQTEAAHALCSGIPEKMKHHFVAPGCGHYGIFSGKKWREVIYPRIHDFIREQEKRA